MAPAHKRQPRLPRRPTLSSSVFVPRAALERVCQRSSYGANNPRARTLRLRVAPTLGV